MAYGVNAFGKGGAEEEIQLPAKRMVDEVNP